MTQMTIMGKIEYNRDYQHDIFTFASFDISKAENDISVEKKNIVLQTIIKSTEVQQVLNEKHCYILFCGEMNNNNFGIKKINICILEPYPTEQDSTFNFE